jgi:hypothetical protein
MFLVPAFMLLNQAQPANALRDVSRQLEGVKLPTHPASLQLAWNYSTCKAIVHKAGASFLNHDVISAIHLLCPCCRMSTLAAMHAPSSALQSMQYHQAYILAHMLLVAVSIRL